MLPAAAMLHAPLILGPQRPEPNLRLALDDLDVDGPLAVISAGWRHDEAELDALSNHAGTLQSVPLYQWFDQVHRHAPLVAQRYRERQQRIQDYKRLYRLRTRYALRTVRMLIAEYAEDPKLAGPSLERATEVVRQIDLDALNTLDALRREYADLSTRFDNSWVRDRRDEAAEILGGAAATLVAGGHVAVLRNRLLFFGVEHALAGSLREDRPIVSWGAGSMALSRRIVLFYDDPPDGNADPEILDHGLGLIDDLVLFPHARDRLRLDDHERVGALARRFAPAMCVSLERGAWLVRDVDGWHSRGPHGSASILHDDGRVRPVEA